MFQVVIEVVTNQEAINECMVTVLVLVFFCEYWYADISC